MDKTFWIGDDGDNKSVKIGSKIFGRGDAIPAEDVAPELIKEWEDKGLISVGKKMAPVVIKDTETVKARDAEIRVLKADLDRLPGLQREVVELKNLLEKAKSGKKASHVKELEADIAELKLKLEAKPETNKEIEGLIYGIEALELDNKEKAALIEKQGKDIEDLTKPVDEDAGAGPGGE